MTLHILYIFLIQILVSYLLIKIERKASGIKEKVKQAFTSAFKIIILVEIMITSIIVIFMVSKEMLITVNVSFYKDILNWNVFVATVFLVVDWLAMIVYNQFIIFKLKRKNK